jgi:hypothetical protein
MNKTVTIEIPSTLRVSLGDTGLINEIPVGDYSDAVLRFALINGFIKAVNDVSRGEDDDGKALTDEAWQAKRDKRMAAWRDGQWAARGAGERGDSNLRHLKEHYYFECLTLRGMTTSKVDAEIKAKVKEILGDEAKATFDNFMLAVATELVEDRKDKDAIEANHKAIESGLQERADKAKAEREKTAAKLDIGSILLTPAKAK